MWVGGTFKYNFNYNLNNYSVLLVVICNLYIVMDDHLLNHCIPQHNSQTIRIQKSFDNQTLCALCFFDQGPRTCARLRFHSLGFIRRQVEHVG